MLSPPETTSKWRQNAELSRDGIGVSTRELLVERLMAMPGSELREELAAHPEWIDRELAYLLKDHCLHGWTGDTARAQTAAGVLRSMKEMSADLEIGGCADWSEGIVALAAGRMETSLNLLDRSARQFREAGKPATAAATQVGKLIALALLGRYDEAVEFGLAAREELLSVGDLLNLGKVEHNLGNIYIRRECYGQAEEFLGYALERFKAIGDRKQQTMVQVNLAFIRTVKNDFRSAEELYDQALQHAVVAGLLVNQADIEANLGTLALYQGKYDRALKLLESARGRFAGLEMPHKSAMAEQELADAYLELNLAPEADAAYNRAAETFYQLGLRAERAQVLAQRGQAAALIGDQAVAHGYLNEARTLFAAEGNHLGAARVQLTEAELLHTENEFAAAAVAAHAAETHLEAAGIVRQAIQARWLRGEALRMRGELDVAEAVLSRALVAAEDSGPPRVLAAGNTSLGQLWQARGEAERAEGYYRAAIRVIEELRAPLTADEFRTSFQAGHLTPYHEMMRLCLEDPKDRLREAFEFCDRARSRALADLLDQGTMPAQLPPQMNDLLSGKLTGLREELNWYYSQLSRPFGRTPDELAALQSEVRTRETRLAETARRIELRGMESSGTHANRGFDLTILQTQLGAETALVEFAMIDGRWLAFIVTGDGTQVVRDLAEAKAATSALQQFRFQIDSLRFGAEAMRRHLPRLTAKIQVPLRELYDGLLRPLMPFVNDRRLVIVPQGDLHYVPFHALFDGEAYVVEQLEVSYAPSASVLLHSLNRPAKTMRRAVLLGAAAPDTPSVDDEIQNLARLFDDPVVLLDGRARTTDLRATAPTAELLHLACHGQFRPDNPLFSSLQLTDEWLTARDVCSLDLRQCQLVTLSACETGISGIKPGDEIIGLARGFFRAGAASLLLSQWVVDDRATAELMIDVYHQLANGERPAAALRSAQRAALAREPHPFFWSPFVLMGRF